MFLLATEFTDSAGAPAKERRLSGHAWSDAFARICDVPEETGLPIMFGRCIVREPMFMDMRDGKDRARLAMSARACLVQYHDAEDDVCEALGRTYNAKHEDLCWAVAEGRRLLRAEMDGTTASEMERFAWIQAVCGLFGRKNIRDWVAREYPYADAAKIDQSIRKASERISSDIKMAGPEAAIPGAMHQYVAAGKDAKTALNNAKEQWDYLDDDTVCRIFAELDKSDI